MLSSLPTTRCKRCAGCGAVDVAYVGDFGMALAPEHTGKEAWITMTPTKLATALLIIASPGMVSATPQFARARAPKRHLEKRVPKSTRLVQPMRGKKWQAEYTAEIKTHLSKVPVSRIVALGALIKPIAHPSDKRVKVETREERFLVEARDFNFHEPFVSLLRVREVYGSKGERRYQVTRNNAEGVVEVRQASKLAKRALRADREPIPMGLTKDSRHHLFFGVGTNVPVTVDIWTGRTKEYPPLKPGVVVVKKGTNERYAKELGLR